MGEDIMTKHELKIIEHISKIDMWREVDDIEVASENIYYITADHWNGYFVPKGVETILSFKVAI